MPTIETITDARIPAYRDAIDAVAREGRFLSFREAPTLEQSRAFIGDLVAGNGVCLLALSEDEVVGWCDINRRPSVYAHSGQLGIGVVAAHRGRGFGMALLTTALANAWTQNFERVELAVYADNLAALALYEKAGFVREGLLRRAAFVEDAFLDVVWMGRLATDMTIMGEVKRS